MTEQTVNTRKKRMKIEEMTKEQIRQAIIKKRECNARALRIVESLLEQGVSEAYFMQCLPDINQSHFEDIIEERSIIRLCGYPICSKNISECDIPKQKYRISTKTNKVYDITTRKSFCSNCCYKSAMHIKKQLLTSPLWFREYEVIPEFHLLPLDTPGSLGQEIDVSLIEKIKVKAKSDTFTSINDFANASLKEMSRDDANMETDQKETDEKPHSDENVQSNNTVEKDVNGDEEEKADEKINKAVDIKSVSTNVNADDSPSCADRLLEGLRVKKQTEKKTTSNPLNIVGEIIEKPERNIDPILTEIVDTASNKTTKTLSAKSIILKKKEHFVTLIVIEVEKCLAEWFTIDTLLFLFGEEKVKEMVADKGECIKEYLNNFARGIFYTSNTYDQYQALCKKLNMLEFEDRKFDAQTLQRETKPLPDYSMLQEESKRMQLKVKAFYAGETEIREIEASDDAKTPEDDNNLTQLPLVDKNAQNALRRRIVCQHLNKVLPDLLQSLGLLTLSISSDVRLIVNTFKLRANNIMFKPIQWTLIAIVIIKLLSLRDKRLEHLLEMPTAYEHMQLLLLSYKQDGGYLDRLISWLTDVDRLLDTNDTQLTTE